MSARAAAARFRIKGGMPSPLLALEGSQEERAKNVSSKEMSIEQRELAGMVEVSVVAGSMSTIKTE